MWLELLEPGAWPSFRWARSKDGDLYVENRDGSWQRLESQTSLDRRAAAGHRTGNWIEADVRRP